MRCVFSPYVNINSNEKADSKLMASLPNKQEQVQNINANAETGPGQLCVTPYYVTRRW